jgi:hypothetical protein
LKEEIAELEDALERETKATTAAPKEEDSEVGAQRHASFQKVVVVTAAAPGRQDCTALRREQPDNDRMKAHYDCLAVSAEYREGD